MFKLLLQLKRLHTKHHILRNRIFIFRGFGKFFVPKFGFVWICVQKKWDEHLPKTGCPEGESDKNTTGNFTRHDLRWFRGGRNTNNPRWICSPCTLLYISLPNLVARGWVVLATTAYCSCNSVYYYRSLGWLFLQGETCFHDFLDITCRIEHVMLTTRTESAKVHSIGVRWVWVFFMLGPCHPNLLVHTSVIYRTVTIMSNGKKHIKCQARILTVHCHQESTSDQCNILQPEKDKQEDVILW